MSHSDEDLVQQQKDQYTKRSEHKNGSSEEEEPRKMCPKIKAKLHLDVYHCKCGTPNCELSSNW